jgi:hypothetical protein
MARGKYETKKLGAGHPVVDVDGGVARGSVVSPPALSPSSSSRARGRTEPPLGIVVMSPWGWRILAVFAMFALGLCVTFFLDGHTVIGAFWIVIAAAWGGFAFKLWRLHLDWDANP